ncbi:MAG: hypothetical protein MUQ10_11890, partial [Anaerolineae bacterium]|nr:hypothetical protein [Anaerolineae bacterium]
KGTRQWQGIPGIECAANGRLWCTFRSGGSKEPDPDNLILLTTSGDGGETWLECVCGRAQSLRKSFEPSPWMGLFVGFGHLNFRL